MNSLSIVIIGIVSFWSIKAAIIPWTPTLEALSYCHRSVCAVLEISNQLNDTMENPVHDLISGLILTYPAEIDAKENATAHYEKRSNTATGSAFMLTYDIKNSTTAKIYAKVSFLVSVPYSQDFHDNVIGAEVHFYENYDHTMPGPKFYEMYGMGERSNWVERTAYHPTGISKEFRSHTDPCSEPYFCLKVVMSIGNSHQTRVPIEIQKCREPKKEC